MTTEPTVKGGKDNRTYSSPTVLHKYTLVPVSVNYSLMKNLLLIVCSPQG